jgi:hypothetical protein
MDSNLLQALIRSASNTVVGAQIRRCQEATLSQHGQFLKGRQALWLIYEHYEVDEGKIGWYDLSDLLGVQFSVDAHMQQFMDSWDTVLCNISRLPATEELAILLYRELAKSKVLEYDLAHYRRLPSTDPNKSYHFLYSCARRYLDEQRREKNRASMAKASGNHGAAPIMAAEQRKRSGSGSRPGSKPRSRPTTPNRGRPSSRDKPKSPGFRTPSRDKKPPSRQTSRSPGGTANHKEGICRYYAQGKNCHFGASCMYKHVKPGDSRKPSPKGSSKTSSPVAPVAPIVAVARLVSKKRNANRRVTFHLPAEVITFTVRKLNPYTYHQTKAFSPSSDRLSQVKARVTAMVLAIECGDAER